MLYGKQKGMMETLEEGNHFLCLAEHIFRCLRVKESNFGVMIVGVGG